MRSNVLYIYIGQTGKAQKVPKNQTRGYQTQKKNLPLFTSRQTFRQWKALEETKRRKGFAMSDNNTTTVPAEFESLKHASQRTALSVKTLRRSIALGDLNAYRYGRIIRVRPTDVNNLLKKQPNPTHYGV